MADEEEDSDDKPFEATQKRLDDARRKGEVPHSADLTAAAGLAGLLVVAFAIGPATLGSMGAALAGMLEHADSLSEVWFSGPSAPATAGILIAIARPALSWFTIPAAAALVVVIAQRAFVISAEKLNPKLNRISPVQGAKRKFGRNGLFEFAKSTTKLLIIGTCLALFGMSELPMMLASMALEPSQVTALMLEIAGRFLAIVFILMVSLGAVDSLWQQAEHMRKHRMSRKELSDEAKESEGDPWLKGRRREKGIEIATNRMLADVPSADVVIVNPTHFAVALKWDRASRGAPTCVAKGIDEVALRIRSRAMEAGVPIRQDPPTARILHEMVDIGKEIAPEHYRAVAVAIRFADRVRGKAQQT